MPLLAAKIAPQRSTQYAALAAVLAEPEMRLSPIGPLIESVRATTLAGQSYLLVELAGEPDREQERALWQLGATTEFYWYYDKLGHEAGPFLKPMPPLFEPYLPVDLIEARRYRGKTNELFTKVALNLARWSRPAGAQVEHLRVLDPLMGGATTLFVALAQGHDAVGIEHQRQDVETTDAFLRKFLEGERIKHRRKAEKLGAGGARRWLYNIEAPERELVAVLIYGDTSEAASLLANIPGGARADVILGDLPYGVQHQGRIEMLLAEALPAWAAVAEPETVLALAWDATRLPRPTMIEWVEAGGEWLVLREGPYEKLSHAVDRVIKRRDLLIAHRLSGQR